jgi:ER degradation enhancer, mannosidase alpha-like 1
MIFFAFLAGFLFAMNDTHRLELKERARQMFDFAFTSYMQHAFPADEIDPINCVGKGRDVDPDNW